MNTSPLYFSHPQTIYQSSMIQPAPLCVGDTVALIAPSSPVKESGREVAVDSLEFLGLKVKVYPSVTSSRGFLAGEDSLRAKDINDAFWDDSVKGIFCSRGGYGTVRVLERLDYEKIRNHPKLIIGFSDITNLLITLNQRCNLITYHGPMATCDYRNLDKTSLKWLKNLLFTPPVPDIIENPPCYIPETIVGGMVEGPLTGGNLSVIAGTLGTPYEIETRGKILFLEDTNEKPYQIDRLLMQLKLAGKLQECQGIILGTFNNCDSDNCDTLSLLQVIKDIIEPLGKPAMKNFAAGHTFPNITLPMGRTVRLNSWGCNITLL